MLDYVVVIRMGAKDVIGILAGEDDLVIKLEHPFTVVYSPTGTISLSPYCILTDETFFEFRRSDIQFLVTATTDIAERFVYMVDMLEKVKTESMTDYLEDHGDQEIDELEAKLDNKYYIDGNTTVH